MYQVSGGLPPSQPSRSSRDSLFPPIGSWCRYEPVIRQSFPGGERSTYCHEGNLLVALISGCAHALRVEDRLVIHQEPILVVAVPEQHFNEPPSILTTSHGMRSRIPGIEIAHEIDRLCRWGDTIEIDRLGGSSGDKRFGAAIKHSSYNGQ